MFNKCFSILGIAIEKKVTKICYLAFKKWLSNERKKQTFSFPFFDLQTIELNLITHTDTNMHSTIKQLH